MKSERGQSAVLAGLLLIFVLGIAFFALASVLPGMKQGADIIAEELLDTSAIVMAHVNNQRIYPNKHSRDTHDVEAEVATNCYNDHGAFFIQANKDGDWYFHCLEEDNRTVRTTIWQRIGNERVRNNLLNLSSHWSKNMERVISVKPLENYTLEIEFEDGLRKVIDIRPFIGEGVSAPLKDEAYFRQVTLEDGGGIAWPNGYDFCPNFLRDDVPAVKVVTT